MRQVDAAVRGVRALALVAKNVQVVAAHAAHDLGPQGLDVSPVARSQTLHKVGDAAGGFGKLRHRSEAVQAAIGQPGRCAAHVVHHIAVGNGAAAAGVVARHAAQGGLRAGGYIDREPQAVGFECGVQMVQDHARLDRGSACVQVQT